MRFYLTLILLAITYQAVGETKYGVFDVSNNIGTVSSKPAIVHGVYINVATSAHTVIIKDGATEVFTIPASATAGNYYSFDEAEFATNLVVDPDDSATGKITVLFEDFAQ